MNAVILAAGEGKRLLPFTLTAPKCFAQVGENTILENALNGLASAGCEVVTIVIGHHAAMIRNKISQKYKGMHIRYIENSKFNFTNNIYSLWLGLKDFLDEPLWILEGDVFFDKRILTISAMGDVAWYVDSSQRHMDGAYVEADTSGRALSLEIVRNLEKLRERQNKSIGILRLSEKGVHLVKDWLQEAIGQGRLNDYYDLVLRDEMKSGTIYTVDIKGFGWYEIDTPEDLKAACQLEKEMALGL